MRRVVSYSGQYPWEWTAAELEAFIDGLRSGAHPIVVSTARGYLSGLQMLLGNLMDPRCGWPEACRERFGRARGALLVFTDALRTGVPPMGEVHENVLSLAMVEAAARSAATGERVLLDDVLADAHAEALRTETHPDVRDALAGWPSVRAVLTAWTPAPETPACGSTPVLPE